MRTQFVAAALFSVALYSLAALAQESRGAIGGRVLDASGVVAGADVHALNALYCARPPIDSRPPNRM
jgi:hypothetical protein